MKNIIKVTDISYRVKAKVIINEVNFSVDKSDTFALLGENGSGKSTLIDLMLNDLKPNKGKICFFGKQKADFSRVGIVYDHLPLFPLLKVHEVIRYFASVHKLAYKSLKIKYFEIFDINKISDSYIKELSQGEKKRLGLLLSIIHNPSLLILDEPFANLDPTIVDRLWKILKRNDRTVLLTTHNWKDSEKIASKIGFLHQGKLLRGTKSPKEIIESLPSSKKVVVNKSIPINGELNGLSYYVHDEELHVFFDKSKNVLSIINQFTNNFSMQNVDLKDAYLYYTVNETSL